ncbi:MAG: LysM peptidoglycan-binding domain-containing protein [Candidatus Saccharimonadales bacterium]
MASSIATTAALRQSLVVQNKKPRKIRRSNFSLAKVAGYTVAFLTFVGIIGFSYQDPQVLNQNSDRVSSVAGVATTTSNPEVASSVDEILAIDLAAGLSERANLPIAPNVASMAVSLSAKSDISQTDDAIIAKPQIIQPTASNRSVFEYTVKSGDTTSTVAQQYNVSADTIRWANNIQGDALEPNRVIRILPVDGVEYTFKSGDSVVELARKYNTSEDRIISFNDLEFNAPVDGQKLLIPGGIVPETERPGYTPPVIANANQNFSGSSGGRVNSLLPATAGNRYGYGQCTWYAYERRAQLGRPVGSFWGDGGSWASSGAAAGYMVNNTPAAGALLVEYGSPGHVGVVESVAADGTVRITEMNNYAYGGWNVVNWRTISAGQAGLYRYVH